MKMSKAVEELAGKTPGGGQGQGQDGGGKGQNWAES
jgi:hypothetical protein